MNEAAMTAEHPALQIDDFASIIGLRTQFAHDRGIIAARHETDVLAVGLCRDAKTETIRECAHLGLGQAAKRKAQIIELRRSRREQEIALVARWIGGPVKLRPTGREDRTRTRLHSGH